MPICEADPWRLQYFIGCDCPADVRIPTEDADCWAWYPKFRWIYDKLTVALSQGLAAAPHGVAPPAFPVFSKPMCNLRGMGIGSRVIVSADEYQRSLTPGHFWMTLLEGPHVSSDVALVDGQPVWWRHTTGVPLPGGIFDHWVVHAAAQPALEKSCGDWARRRLRGYTGMLNLETIGGTIIEAHLRFADQWPDLYGAGWVDALIALYAKHHWAFADSGRVDGYSVVLFVPHGRRYHAPPADMIERYRHQYGVSSIQITFHPEWDAGQHAMPPGGFRVAIVNGVNLAQAQACREALRQWFL